jgi:hypothetical protein
MQTYAKGLYVQTNDLSGDERQSGYLMRCDANTPRDLGMLICWTGGPAGPTTSGWQGIPPIRYPIPYGLQDCQQVSLVQSSTKSYILYPTPYGMQAYLPTTILLTCSPHRQPDGIIGVACALTAHPKSHALLRVQAQQQVRLQLTATTRQNRATLPDGDVHILQINSDRESAPSGAPWQLVVLLSGAYQSGRLTAFGPDQSRPVVAGH